MSLREIIWPTRWKITLALLIGAVSVFLIYLASPYYQDALFSLDLHLRIASVFLSFAIVTLIYYPLSCGVIFLYGSFRKKPVQKSVKKAEKGKKPEKAAKTSRRDMIIAVLLILIFNPLTFSLFYGVSMYVNANVINYPCGVEIFGFAENSPAQLANMTTGEVIIRVDNQTISTTSSLTSFLAGKSPGDYVRIKTSLGEYNIRLGENSQTHKAVMGIITQNAYCRRW